MKGTSTVVVIIGLFFILLGVYAFLNPMGLYALFNPPSFEPPFDASDLTAKSYIPSIILFIAGIGFILSKIEEIVELKESIGSYTEEVSAPSYEVDSTDKVMEEPPMADDDLEIEEEPIEVFGTKHEFQGMEVYTELGAYWGIVKNVTLDANGMVDEFVVEKGSEQRIVRMDEVASTDNIILVKED